MSDRWDRGGGWILALGFLASFVLSIPVIAFFAHWLETATMTDLSFGCFCIAMGILFLLFCKEWCERPEEG